MLLLVACVEPVAISELNLKVQGTNRWYRRRLGHPAKEIKRIICCISTIGKVFQ